MNSQNALQKKIIKALANAPAAALRELIRQTSNKEEIDYINRVAVALNIKLNNGEWKSE